MTLNLPAVDWPCRVLGRSTVHGKAGSMTLNGVSHIYVNSGRMYGTLVWSAPASRKITTRLPALRIVPRVGQVRVSAGVVLNEGTNARLESPAF